MTQVTHFFLFLISGYRDQKWTGAIKSKGKKKKKKKKEEEESSFSLRDMEKCRVCARLVRNEHVLSLENVPSVEKEEEGRYRYSREGGRREMVAAVGGNSERAGHERNFFTSFFCTVREIITSQRLEHSRKFCEARCIMTLKIEASTAIEACYYFDLERVQSLTATCGFHVISPAPR